MPVRLHGLDISRHGPRFIRTIPIAVDAQLFTRIRRGIKRLAQPAFIARDDPGRRRQNMTRRPVILFQPDNGRPRKIAFKLQDVANLGPAPAIDRLVVIADAAQVAVRSAGAATDIARH